LYFSLLSFLFFFIFFSVRINMFFNIFIFFLASLAFLHDDFNFSCLIFRYLGKS